MSEEPDAKTRVWPLSRAVIKGCEHVSAPRKCPSFLTPGQTLPLSSWPGSHQGVFGAAWVPEFWTHGCVLFSDELHIPWEENKKKWLKSFLWWEFIKQALEWMFEDLKSKVFYYNLSVLLYLQLLMVFIGLGVQHRSWGVMCHQRWSVPGPTNDGRFLWTHGVGQIFDPVSSLMKGKYTNLSVKSAPWIHRLFKVSRTSEVIQPIALLNAWLVIDAKTPGSAFQRLTQAHIIGLEYYHNWRTAARILAPDLNSQIEEDSAVIISRGNNRH